MASPDANTMQTTVAGVPARRSNAAPPAAAGPSHRSATRPQPETAVTPHRQTGPRTAAGKAAASRNARTHGLLSDDPIATPYEQPEAWHDHRQAVTAALDPFGYLETVLAERLALLHWRLARAARHEAALIARDRFRLACESAERRYTGPDGRLSTAAGLEAERRRCRDHRALLYQLARLDDDADLVDEDAHDMLQALLAPFEDPERIVPLLRDSRPGEDIAASCVRQPWTVAGLQAALAPLLAETHDTFAELCTAAIEHADDACAELDRSWSDEEIAVAAAAHNLPDLSALERLARYEAHLSRELARATHELDRLQTQRRAAEQHDNCETNPSAPAVQNHRRAAEQQDNCETNPSVPAVQSHAAVGNAGGVLSGPSPARAAACVPSCRHQRSRTFIQCRPRMPQPPIPR